MRGVTTLSHMFPHPRKAIGSIARGCHALLIAVLLLLWNLSRLSTQGLSGVTPPGGIELQGNRPLSTSECKEVSSPKRILVVICRAPNQVDEQARAVLGLERYLSKKTRGAPKGFQQVKQDIGTFVKDFGGRLEGVSHVIHIGPSPGMGLRSMRRLRDALPSRAVHVALAWDPAVYAITLWTWLMRRSPAVIISLSTDVDGIRDFVHPRTIVIGQGMCALTHSPWPDLDEKRIPPSCRPVGVRFPGKPTEKRTQLYEALCAQISENIRPDKFLTQVVSNGYVDGDQTYIEALTRTRILVDIPSSEVTGASATIFPYSTLTKSKVEAITTGRVGMGFLTGSVVVTRNSSGIPSVFQPQADFLSYVSDDELLGILKSALLLESSDLLDSISASASAKIRWLTELGDPWTRLDDALIKRDLSQISPADSEVIFLWE